MTSATPSRLVATGVLCAAICWPAVLNAEDGRVEKLRGPGWWVEVWVPADLTVMRRELLEKKYTRGIPPMFAYSTERGTVSLAVGSTETGIPSTVRIEEARKEMAKQLRGANPGAEWLRDEVVQVNGRRFFLFDVRTPAVDTVIRNLMLGTLCEARMVLINFNVTKEEEETWMSTRDRIVRSVRVRVR